MLLVALISFCFFKHADEYTSTCTPIFPFPHVGIQIRALGQDVVWSKVLERKDVSSNNMFLPCIERHVNFSYTWRCCWKAQRLLACERQYHTNHPFPLPSMTPTLNMQKTAGRQQARTSSKRKIPLKSKKNKKNVLLSIPCLVLSSMSTKFPFFQNQIIFPNTVLMRKNRTLLRHVWIFFFFVKAAIGLISVQIFCC